MTAPELSRTACDEHCDEHHGYAPREALREQMLQLVDAHHRSHDDRFPWSLCSRDTCRETAIALGVR